MKWITVAYIKDVRLDMNNNISITISDTSLMEGNIDGWLLETGSCRSHCYTDLHGT